jgi:uncharacterized coiled-coil protein SlyX
MMQIQTLMDINMRVTGVQATVTQLNDKLTTFETKLQEVQASTIKLGWCSSPLWSNRIV